MKKIFFLINICFAISYGQIINIPDVNFKNRLLQASPSNVIAYSSSSGYIKIDANNNGEIEQNEALNVTNLVLNNQNISNLEGLQYFTNLTVLQTYHNSITTLNLSTLTNLVSLECTVNQISSLDLTVVPHLEYLFCNNNLISQLDFSGLPNLKGVYCGNNLLTSLDFSNNPLFEELGCKSSPNLTSIKFKNNRQQLFGSQTIFLNECWTGCPNLNYICADAFEIPALQSYLSGCGITQAITIDSACPLLGNDGFEVKEILVSPNPSASVFTIAFPALINTATLLVYNVMGQSVYSTTISPTEVYLLDMSMFSSGCYLLKITNGDETFTTRIIKE